MSSHPITRFAFAAVLLVSILFGFAQSASARPQGPPAAVRVDAVRQESLAERRQVTGELRSIHRAEVASREAGLVEVLEVREGQSVEKGAVLARLDAEQLELEVMVLEAQRAPAEARVTERRSDLAQKDSDLQALTELVGKDAANPKELADAKTARTASEARLKESEGELLVIAARIELLRVRIRDMTIRAPFNGTVISRRCELGTWLGKGGAVCELLSTEALEVWLEVPQALLASTRSGEILVSATVDATGETLTLEGCRAIPDVDARSRTFRLVAPVGPSPSFAAGMSVTALIPTESVKDQLTISRDAIMRNEVGAYVYVVMPGGEGQPASAAPMNIEVLFQTEERAVVRGAQLKPGMSVIVEGNERLFPMAPIIPIPAGGAGGGPPGDGTPPPGQTPPDGGPPAEEQR